MDIRHPVRPDRGKALDTEGLRKEFLITDLFSPGRSSSSTATSPGHRWRCGPRSAALPLEVEKAVIGSDHLLDSRELGILNLGGEGSVGRRREGVPAEPAGRALRGEGDEIRGVLVPRAPLPPRSSTCSRPSPTRSSHDAHRQGQGEAGRRRIPRGVQPADDPPGHPPRCRRELQPDDGVHPPRAGERVEHHALSHAPAQDRGVPLLRRAEGRRRVPSHGHPDETRHIVARNEQGIISPSWSIHSGVGTAGYSFVWAMAGENQTFTDMDAVAMDALR